MNNWTNGPRQDRIAIDAVNGRLTPDAAVRQDYLGWRRSRFGDTLLSCVILANLAMLIFYSAVTYRAFFHSDAAAINLLSEEIVRSGQFFPRDWNYVNADLFVIFGHLFIIPFIPFVRNGFALHAVAGVVSAVIIVASVWLLLVRMGVSRTGRLFSLAILTSGISPYLSENLFGQVSYGTVLYLLALQLLFILSFFQARLNGRRRDALLALCALAVLMFLTALANPFRGLATYILPIFGGLILIKLLAQFSLIKSELASFCSWRALTIAGSVAVLTVLAGALAHTIVMTRVNNVMGAGDARFLGYEAMLHNVVGAIRAWLYLSGGLSEPSERVLSINGLYASVRLIASIAALSLPYWIYRLAQRSDGRVFFVAMCSLISFAVVLFFFVFTTVPDMTSADTTNMSSRYFTVPFVMMLIVAVSSIDRQVCNWGQTIGGMFCLMVFALAMLAVGFINLVRPAIAAVADEKSVTYKIAPSGLDGIVAELQRQGLHYGYASYWNANAISVLSSSEQRVRPIEIAPVPRPMRHLSSNQWYRPIAWRGQTFFLLTNAEYEKLDWKSMAHYLGPPARVVQVDQSVIVVYSYNVAERLPGWDDSSTKPTLLLAWPGTPHQIGHFDDENQVMVGDRGQSGFLMFGPYIALPAGHYQVTFELDTDEADAETAGFVDVVAGATTLARSDIVAAGERREITVALALDKETRLLEFRVFLNGKSRVNVRRVTVRRTEEMATDIAPIRIQR